MLCAAEQSGVGKGRGRHSQLPLSENIMVSRAQREGESPSRDPATLTVLQEPAKYFQRGKGH